MAEQQMETFELQRLAFIEGLKLGRAENPNEPMIDEAYFAKKRYPDPHNRRVIYSCNGVAIRFDRDGTLQWQDYDHPGWRAWEGDGPEIDEITRDVSIPKLRAAEAYRFAIPLDDPRLRDLTGRE